MSIKSYLTKKMLAKKMKGVPPEQQEKIFAAIEKNPEFFKKISKETEDLMKNSGKSQMAASMEVMRKHQDELRKLMS